MKTKKILIISGVTILAGGLLFLLYQYNKLMQYVLNFKGIRVKEINSKRVKFDLDVEFVNQSDLSVRIRKQKYKVYVNDKFVSQGGTDKGITLKPKGGTTLTNNVEIKPSDLLKALKKTWADIIVRPELVNIKIDYQVNASLFGVGIPIKNSYTITLKEIMAMRGK